MDKMDKNDGLGSVSAEGRSGVGLPYAPADWPDPGDVWTWTAGKRITADGGFYADRSLYPPERLPRGEGERRRFRSKASITAYLRSEFPETDVKEFFKSFTWPIPVNLNKSGDKGPVNDLSAEERLGVGLPYAPADWPDPGDVWTWTAGKRITGDGGFYRDRSLLPPKRLYPKGIAFRSKSSITAYLRSKFPETDVEVFFKSFTWQIPVNFNKSGDKVSRGNKDEDKKPGQKPIQIDATEEVVKGCTSSLEVNVVSDSQLIGITSDDEDSIELNSVSKKNCHYVDDEALSKERVHVHGFDGVESDRVIKFSPVNILIGDEIFWVPQLTLRRNHVKLEAEGRAHISREWTTADIVGIKCVWSKEISRVRLHLHLKSKDGESVINVEDSGIIKLDWEVHYADWQELQNGIWALDSRYKEAWLTDSLDDAVNIEGVSMDKFSSHHFRDADDFVVSFPKGDLYAVSIRWSDVQLLQQKTFINDTIIDFYMKYLKDKVKHKEVPRFHFFNCFFFGKLVDLDGDFSIEPEGREAFLRVHKWTRKLDLFEKDYILIPVNFSFHWSLIVICHPAEVANLKDEEMKKLANPEEKEMEELCKMPCILHMDSLKGKHRGLRKLFQGYLSEEWKERHNDLVVDISSRFWDVPFLSLEVPQQPNLIDCGLFLLHYAELFMKAAPENFNYLRILKSSSNFLKEHWFIPAEASSKRAHIKQLIDRIYVDHSCDVGAFDIGSPSESTAVNELLEIRP